MIDSPGTGDISFSPLNALDNFYNECGSIELHAILIFIQATSHRFWDDQD